MVFESVMTCFQSYQIIMKGFDKGGEYVEVGSQKLGIAITDISRRTIMIMIMIIILHMFRRTTS